MNRYFVRIAATDDIEHISLALATSWKTAYRGIVNDDYLNSLTDSHWVDFLTAGLNGDAIFSMVLQDNQEIIGASILGKSDKEGEIHLISLYLLPDKIGKGFGHIFYCEIEKEIVKRGFIKCALEVLKNNHRAIHFYQSHGFIASNAKIIATLGAQNYACKLFEKSLP